MSLELLISAAFVAVIFLCGGGLGGCGATLSLKRLLISFKDEDGWREWRKSFSSIRRTLHENVRQRRRPLQGLNLDGGR